MSDHRSPPPSLLRVSLLLGTLIAFTVVGSSAVAVALPDVARELSLDTAGTAWVFAAFSMAFAISTALFGRIADLRGLRAPLRAGVVLFAAGSVLAALSWSFASLVAGRLLQGVGAGAVPVLVLGIVTTRFDESRRGAVLGGLMAVVAVVSGSGPLIGGILAEFVSWRAVLAVPVLTLVVGEPVARSAPAGVVAAGKLDLVGAALVGASVAGVMVLLQGPATRPPAAVLVTVVLATAVCAAATALHTRRHPEGFLPAAVVRNRPLLLTAVTGLTLIAAYLGMLLAVPLLLDQLGWGALRIGVALVPAALIGAATSPLAGRLGDRAGRYRVAAWLAGASTVGLLLAGASPARPVVLVAGLALVMAGFAGGQAVLIDIVPRLVPASSRGVALGVFNLVFFVGGAVGAAAVGGLGGSLGLPAALTWIALLPAVGVATALLGHRVTRSPAAVGLVRD